MSSGIRALRRIQCSPIESPRGTLAAATFRLIGTLSMKQNQKYYRPNELETGRLSDYERSYITGEQMAAVYDSDAQYESLGYLLGMTVRGAVTGGAPSDSLYTYTYAPNLTASSVLDTRTLEYGDDVQAFVSSFVFGTDLEISGSLDDVVKVKSNLVGQNQRTQAFTGSLSNPTTLTPVIVGTGKLYVDTSWAGIGGTLVASTLIDFSYKVTPGQTPIKYIDGNIYFTDIAEKKRHVELEATLAFTAGTAGYFADYIASPQNKKFIRIKFLGPLVGVSSKDELDLDGCFVIDDYPEITERDGQDIVKIRAVSQYDVTGTKDFQIILKNGISAYS